jgi:peroxiredoxin
MRNRKVLIAVALAIVIAALVAVGVALLTADTDVRPPAGTIPAVDLKAPESLVAAAANSGFVPTNGAGTGDMELRPASAAKPPSTQNLLPVGAQAPDFTLRTPTGERVSLRDFRGKAVLLEFFATWCPHCNAEALHVKRLYESLPKDRVAFVSINGDGETAPSVFAYHVWWRLPFPTLLDPNEDDPGTFRHPGARGPVTAGYGVLLFPTFFVVDPRGRIAWRSDGEQPNALLRRELLAAAR